jgi:transposase-like protein
MSTDKKCPKCKLPDVMTWVAQWGGRELWHCSACGTLETVDYYSHGRSHSSPAIIDELRWAKEELAMVKAALAKAEEERR